jgi:hypothetical protein
VSIAGYFFGRDAVQGRITDQIADLIGINSALAIENMITNAALTANSTFAVIFGTAMLLFGATGVFFQLKKAMNNIWNVTSRKDTFLKMIIDRIISFGMHDLDNMIKNIDALLKNGDYKDMRRMMWCKCMEKNIIKKINYTEICNNNNNTTFNNDNECYEKFSKFSSLSHSKYVFEELSAFSLKNLTNRRIENQSVGKFTQNNSSNIVEKFFQIFKKCSCQCKNEFGDVSHNLLCNDFCNVQLGDNYETEIYGYVFFIICYLLLSGTKKIYQD